MSSYNKVIMMGHLTRDPILSGPFCKFTIAANHRYKKDGQQVDEACFIDVDVYGKSGENCMKYLTKGRQALVEGRLVYKTWTDDSGQARNKMSIMAETVTFVGSKQENEQQENPTPFVGVKSANDKQVIEQYDQYKNSELPF